MKKAITLLLLASSTSLLEAQTPGNFLGVAIRKYKPEPGDSTSEGKLPDGRRGRGYTPEPGDFRVVDSKVYNIILSTNWVKVPTVYDRIRVNNVNKDGVFFRVENGFHSNRSSDPDTYIFVKNYPGRDKLTTDQFVERMVVMQSGVLPSTNRVGYIVKAYNYGLPNTPENRKNGNVAEP